MIKRFMSNDFNKNVLKLMTGATVAQAIPVAISPILTRLYTPEDFGVLALFIAITAIFGSIANARYELAIVLPEKEEDSINTVALCILVALSMSLFLLVITVIFHNEILLLLGNEQIGMWLYFAPPVVFFIGIFNALNYLNTRLKTFGVIAQVKVIKSVTMVLFQLLLGLFKPGVAGLISGQIISHVFSNGKLVGSLFMNKELIKKIKMRKIKQQAKRYSRFPKITMWATLSNSLSLHSVNIFISAMYSATSLGFYSLIQRVLGMPSTLVSSSIGQVFFQNASEEKNLYGNARKSYKSTLIKLTVFGIVFFGILFFIVEDLVDRKSVV